MPRLRFRFDGETVVAEPGQTVAAALAASGRHAISHAASGAARGVFCGMGLCNDCLVEIDGQGGQRACMAPAVEGQDIRSMPARADLTRPDLADLAPLPGGPLPGADTDVLVVGAGPAGLAAARALASAGASGVVADEFSAPGGQYYKQAAGDAADALYAGDRQMRDGAALIASLPENAVEIRGETLVWGGERMADGGLRLGLIGPAGASYLRPRALLIATGAMERPDPVPGWTLPGVMTTGAAQTLLRKSGALPGRRVFIAGNGPLNLQVASELLAAGAGIAGLAEAAPDPSTRPALAAELLLRGPGLAFRGLRLLSGLRRAGVPLHWASRVTRIEDAAEGLRVRLSDGSCHEADAVLLGGNFAPSTELGLLLGCGLGEAGGLRADAQGRTDQPDIFVAGEAARFGGAHVALAAGAEAGRAIARALGLPGAGALPDRAARAARHRDFQAALWRLYAPAEAAPAPEDDALLCRCESVTAGTLRALVHDGITDLPTLKRLSRAGMGRCQARYCQPRLAALLPEPTGATPLAPQMPLRPVPLAALAVEKPEWGGHRKALLPDRPAAPNPEPLPFAEIDTLVIGGGIAGLSTAMWLARDGHPVAVLERAVPNALASGGNAGSLHAQLLSFDHGAKAEGDGSAAAQTLPLQRDSIGLWLELQRDLGRDVEAKITGGLMVAETAAHLAAMETKTALERRMGIEARVIGAAELRALEPALGDFIGAAYCPQEGKINPLLATQAVRDEALARGAQILTRTEVTAIAREGAGFTVTTNRGRLRARAVVNAAGAFASRIGAMLGLDVPVHGAPLQMVVTEAVAPLVTHLLAHADRHLTLKQAGNGNILIGGGWTAGLDPVHQHPRPLLDSIEGNLWAAQHVVPALRRLKVIRSWAAMNINIDGAPILGEDPRCPGFFNAVTSNGYTLGPIVGRLTAALVAGRAEPGLAPFSIARFERNRT